MNDRDKPREQLLDELGELRRRVAESESSQAKYRLLVETTSDFIWEVDQDRVFIYVSPQVKDLLGYEPAELVGRAAFDLVSSDETKRLRGLDLETGPPDQPFTRLDATLLHRDGHEVTVEASGVPVFDESGNYRGMRGISRDVTQRRQAEETLREERQHQGRLLEMHEQNRKLVAYEIHDGVVQPLVGAKFFFEAALHGISQQCSESECEAFQAGVRLLGDGISQARTLMGGQRPLVLDERGLVAAIEYLASESTHPGDAKIEFTHDVAFDRLAPPLETAIFRIVQESLSNACRHSQSDRVRIELVQCDGSIRAEVEDWGVGFAAESVTENCFGLEGLRKRVHLFDGSATVRSAPGEGTRIAVEFPLVHAQSNPAG